MPTITITFDHPQAPIPKYKFGERIAVKDDYHPQNWLTGEVVGLTLETEIFSPRWWYSVRYDLPVGYTEDHAEDELVPETEIVEQIEAKGSEDDNYAPLPKFQAGARVRLNAQSGFSNLIKDFALVVSSKYVTSKYWSGWTYELTNENLTSPIEIGEIWLELAPTTAEALTDKHPVSK